MSSRWPFYVLLALCLAVASGYEASQEVQDLLPDYMNKENRAKLRCSGCKVCGYATRRRACKWPSL